MDSLGTRAGWKALLCCFVFIGPNALVAQQPVGEIRLEVKDPSGAAVKARASSATWTPDWSGHSRQMREACMTFEACRMAATNLGFLAAGSLPNVQIDVQTSALSRAP